jgi:hypothetical protein
MKRIPKISRLILIASVLCVAALFCSFGGKVPQTITGHVHMYGNEPFAFAGFETDDGKLYTLAVNKKKTDANITLKQIESFQGELLELTGTIEPVKENSLPGFNILKDGTFIVYSYTDLTGNSNK